MKINIWKQEIINNGKVVKEIIRLETIGDFLKNEVDAIDKK